MYNIVFLLLFSAITSTVSESKRYIQMYIDFDSNKITCLTNPPSPVSVTEEDIIQFVISTPTFMNQFWCDNGPTNTIYQYYPRTTSSDYVYDKSRYDWKAPVIYMTPDKIGAWICLFYIKLPYGKTFKGKTSLFGSDNYAQGTCELKLLNADVPASPELISTTLSPALTEYTRTRMNTYPKSKDSPVTAALPARVTENNVQETKGYLQFTGVNYTLVYKGISNDEFDQFVYKYKVGDILQLACEITGTQDVPNILFYDNSEDKHTMTKMKRHRITLNKDHENSYFECNSTKAWKRIRLSLKLNKLEDKTSTKPITGTKTTGYEPDLAKITLDITGSEQLKIFTTKGSTTVITNYNYNFTDEETITLDCNLHNPTSKSETYKLAFYLDDVIMNQMTADTNSTFRTANLRQTFNINKINRNIKCQADNVGVANRRVLLNVIKLHNTPSIPTPSVPYLNMRGSPKLELVKSNSTMQFYNLSFTKGKKLDLKCDLENAEKNKYSLYCSIEYSATSTDCISGSKELRATKSIRKTIQLTKYMKSIKCFAKDMKSTVSLTNAVHLNYTSPPSQPDKHKQPDSNSQPDKANPTSKSMNLKITGLRNECKTQLFETTCEHDYRAEDIGRSLPLNCVLSGGTKRANILKYVIDFAGVTKNVTLGSKTPVSYDVTLDTTSRVIQCVAKLTDTKSKSTDYVVKVHLNYIETSTYSPSSTAIPSSTTDTIITPSPSKSPLSESWTDFFNKWWINPVLIGSLALITFIIAVRCTMSLCRRKKPPLAEPNYANLTRDTDYSTMPVAAPRTMKPNVVLPTLPQNKKMTLESTYSEPKDSQDMSDALYADPRRFAAESDTYAEPYVKSDTYAEPYKSEPAYAELNSTKELYAKPIPKSQRKPKITNDSNYSNVFGSDYGNAKK